MFGRMMVEPIVQTESGVNLQTAIAVLTKVTENVEIVRCSGYVFALLAPLPRGEWQTRLVSVLPCDGQDLAKATL